ncbi:MAG TPA: helix-turn-helix domain-containing protein [Actinomycetota bacterium]|nr:helix-turn-helix domain-containing protein [Actinomycetota bacterium]
MKAPPGDDLSDRRAERARERADAVARLREPEFGPVSVVQRVLGVGRSRAYQLCASGEIASIRLGRSLRVDLASLDQYVADLRADRTLA